jgi:hypothetical protein
MTYPNLSAKVAADLGLPDDHERDSQQRAVLALVMEALHYRNPPTGPDYRRILALGRAALAPDPAHIEMQAALDAWNARKGPRP